MTSCELRPRAHADTIISIGTGISKPGNSSYYLPENNSLKGNFLLLYIFVMNESYLAIIMMIIIIIIINII